MPRLDRETRQDYDRMDGSWPETIPAVTFVELTVAYRRLRKKFVPGRRDLPMKFIRTSGRRWSGVQCVQYPKDFLEVRLNPDRGWKDFVHWLSHNFAGGHGERHLRMEWKMIQHVIKSGWLEGRLKRDQKAARPKPPLVERRAANAKRALERAEHAAANADRRVRKWRRKVTYYERSIAAPI